MNYFKSAISIIVVVLLSNNVINGQKMTRAQYIEKYKDIAIKEMKEFGIPASITIAQACLESADGNSKLALLGNNHFGIKCNNWLGDTILHNDDKSQECFRKYQNAFESFSDHSLFLSSKERYSSLFKLDLTDYKSWAVGLKAAGYATNPQYANQLIKIIEDFQLNKYDYLDSAQVIKIRKSSEYTAISTDSTLEKSTNHHYDFSVSRNILTRNRVKYIISVENDSYKGLAKEFNLFKKEILKFNDLDKEVNIKPGTVVYIQKKKKKNYGDQENYTIINGDTYNSISQKFGIRLSSLLKINSLNKNNPAKEGDIIKLK